MTMKNIFQKIFTPKEPNVHHDHGIDRNNPHILLKADTLPLDTDLQWALATGAPLSLTNDFPLNIIDPEQTQQHMLDWLADSWNIHTRDDLGYELTNLFAAGHSKVFNTLLQFSDGYTSADRTEKAIQVLAEEMQQHGGWEVNTSYDFIHEFSQNIPEAVAFIYEHFAPLTTSIPSIKTEAYDIDRIVTISRVAYGAKLFDTSLAEQNIIWAGSYAQAIYKDWREFAIGYLVGRAIWGGVPNEDFLYRVKIVDLLLKDPKSPWNTLGWIPAKEMSLFTAHVDIHKQ